jgi:monoamine oxidase
MGHTAFQQYGVCSPESSGIRMQHPMIIIGAGIAGLSAGQALATAGLQPLILEARERIGGRIHTDHCYGPVELGAEFIHGDRAVTWEFVRTANLATIPWGDDRRFGIQGAIVPADDPLGARVVHLYSAAYSYAGPDLDVAQLIGSLAAPNDPAATIALRWLANIEGADPHRLSALAVAREHALSTNGSSNFHLIDGYDAVTRMLAAGLNVQCASPVQHIAWSSTGATLTLASGAQHHARRVIITIPLGVLQAEQPAFDPPLPAAKRTAINALAMGQVTKLALWFDRRLWPEFTVLSTDGRIATWWPVETATTPTLMGYTGGPAALDLANLGEAEAIATALADLEQLLGPDVRRACLGGRLAAWSHDPWSRGAYSYTPVGAGAARAVLAAPVDDVLFFAGEASVTNGHVGTVHGAIETGRRAALEALG